MKHLLLLSLFALYSTTVLLAEEALPSSDEVFSGILNAQGGSAALAKIQSMRVQGHIETLKETIPFTLVRKKPNYVRLTLDYPQGNFVIAYNGTVVWSRLAGASYKDVTLVTGEDAENFKLNAPFFGYLLEPARYNTQIKTIEWSTWEKQTLLKIKVHTNDSEPIEYYLEPESYRVVRMVFNEIVDGKKILRDSRFTDFRSIGTLNEAYHTEVITDGKRETTQIVKTFELNPGVLDTSFNPPEGTLLTTPKKD
jgi:hypothetical protein